MFVVQPGLEEDFKKWSSFLSRMNTAVVQNGCAVLWACLPRRVCSGNSGGSKFVAVPAPCQSKNRARLAGCVQAYWLDFKHDRTHFPVCGGSSCCFLSQLQIRRSTMRMTACVSRSRTLEPKVEAAASIGSLPSGKLLERSSDGDLEQVTGPPKDDDASTGSRIGTCEFRKNSASPAMKSAKISTNYVGTENHEASKKHRNI